MLVSGSVTPLVSIPRTLSVLRVLVLGTLGGDRRLERRRPDWLATSLGRRRRRSSGRHGEAGGEVMERCSRRESVLRRERLCVEGRSRRLGVWERVGLLCVYREGKGRAGTPMDEQPDRRQAP